MSLPHIGPLKTPQLDVIFVRKYLQVTTEIKNEPVVIVLKLTEHCWVHITKPPTVIVFVGLTIKTEIDKVTVTNGIESSIDGLEFVS